MCSAWGREAVVGHTVQRCGMARRGMGGSYQSGMSDVPSSAGRLETGLRRAHAW